MRSPSSWPPVFTSSFRTTHQTIPYPRSYGLEMFFVQGLSSFQHAVKRFQLYTLSTKPSLPYCVLTSPYGLFHQSPFHERTLMLFSHWALFIISSNIQRTKVHITLFVVKMATITARKVREKSLRVEVFAQAANLPKVSPAWDKSVEIGHSSLLFRD